MSALKALSSDDEWYTSSKTIEMIIPYLPEGCDTIWEPFLSAEVEDDLYESVTRLRDEGFEVLTPRQDFFSNVEGGPATVVVSNPPYHTPKGCRNTKERVLERLCELERPFALLLPTYYLQTKSFKRMQDAYGHFSVVMPSAKIEYYKVRDGKKTYSKTKCSFYSVWLCHRLGAGMTVV